VIADEVGHNLPGAATQGHPTPALVVFLEHKRPHFIPFQDIIHLGRGQRFFHRWQARCPLLEPPRQGSSRQAKDTGDTAQTGSFQHWLSIAVLGGQRTIPPTAFTVVFLCAFVIVSVSHQILAATFGQ